MSILIGLSGRKESGKDTLFNWYAGYVLTEAQLFHQSKLSPDGKLYAEALYEDEYQWGKFDFGRREPEFLSFLYNEVFPLIRPFNMADPVKEFCVNMLGLRPEDVYGSNEDKNKFTSYTWESLPIGPKTILAMQTDGVPIRQRHGWMRVREVIQYWATEIFREVDYDIHKDATMRQIEQSSSERKVVRDVRFENEVRGIQEAGGKVIRLTRNVHEDNHYSETSLDDYPLDQFDAVIENHYMTQEQTVQCFREILRNWDWL